MVILFSGINNLFMLNILFSIYSAFFEILQRYMEHVNDYEILAITIATGN
jgi:hypothetical protein